MPRILLFILIHLLVFVSADRADCDPVPGLVEAARNQVGRTVLYDPAYYGLTYPKGDLPLERGVCADVVIRALRSAYGLDLQKLVHEDMKKDFPGYPRTWGLRRPDKNIDHRRVPNLQVFFRKKGWSLVVSDAPDDYRPGDIVTCTIPPHRPHIMIVSEKKNRRGIPLVIHNIGAGVREEDRLFEFSLTGHYRIPAASSNATVQNIAVFKAEETRKMSRCGTDHSPET